MEDKDYIEQLFSTKLKDAEMPVSSELWTKVSAGIQSTGAVSGTTVGSSFLKGKLAWLAASVIGVAGIGTAVYLSQSDEEPVKPKVVQVEQTNIETSEEVAEETNVNESTENNSLNVERSESEEIKVEETIENSEPEVIVGDEVDYKDVIEDEQIAVLPTRNPNVISNSPLEQEVDTRTPVTTKTDKEVIETPDVPSENLSEKKEVVLPTVFSPNGDGIEDYLYIKDLNGVSDFQVVVLNNKNQVVYSSNDINFRWDGRNAQGEIVEQGNYVYFLTGINSDGTKFNKASQLFVSRQR